MSGRLGRSGSGGDNGPVLPTSLEVLKIDIFLNWVVNTNLVFVGNDLRMADGKLESIQYGL
jgi:hypothetical protein